MADRLRDLPEALHVLDQQDLARAEAFVAEGERLGCRVEFEHQDDKPGFGDTCTGLVTDQEEEALLLEEINREQIEEWSTRIGREMKRRKAENLSLRGIADMFPEPASLTSIPMPVFFTRGYACHGMTRMEALNLALERYRHRRSARQQD